MSFACYTGSRECTGCMRCQEAYDMDMATCQHCGREKREDTLDLNGVCRACKAVILGKFADHLTGYFDALELAVIDDASDGIAPSEIVEKYYKEVPSHAS